MRISDWSSDVCSSDLPLSTLRLVVLECALRIDDNARRSSSTLHRQTDVTHTRLGGAEDTMTDRIELGAGVPRRRSRVRRAIGRRVLTLSGWTLDILVPDAPQLVVIDAPHPSHAEPPEGKSDVQ